MSRSRWLRWTLGTVAVLLTLGLVGFFALAPGIVERGMNQVADEDLDEVDPETRRLHDSLTVADMHADTLLSPTARTARQQHPAYPCRDARQHPAGPAPGPARLTPTAR